MTNIYAACNDLNGYAKVNLDPTVISFFIPGKQETVKKREQASRSSCDFPYFATLSLPALDDLE